MLVKLTTACGCFRYMDLQENLAHHRVRIPLVSRKSYFMEESSLGIDFPIREFEYDRYIDDELIGKTIPLLRERVS